LTIENLITKCKQQDKKAQETLYRMFSPKFFVLCLKYSSSYEQAKDSLHDGFIKIFQNISKYNERGSFEGWMTRVIINNALREYQNKSIFIKIEEEYFEEAEIETEEEELSYDFLMKLIRELPSQYRVVFNLYAMDGYSHEEISKSLNISIGTSKSNLSRARKKLKENIETYKLSEMELGL
jgi:RNA polymerase sigma factor (sigma-70 family)